MNKMDIVKAWYGNETYDAALPQEWVNAMTERGLDPRGHFVALYPKQGHFYMAPVTMEGVRQAAIVATFAA